MELPKGQTEKRGRESRLKQTKEEETREVTTQWVP